MSYPPPPGLKSSNSSSNTPQPPASLPPRPPPATGPPATASFKGFSTGSNNGAAAAKPGYNAFTAFAPRSIASPGFRTNSPANYSSPPTTSYATVSPYPQDTAHPGQPQYSDQSYGQSSAPHIRNPFAPPSAGTSNTTNAYGSQATVDPEMEAQILQWQSAYMAKESDTLKQSGTVVRREGPTGANSAPLGVVSRLDGTTPTSTATGVSNSAGATENSNKTVYRSGGGTSWTDSSLLEWDPAHFRLFVGNLAGEVTDDSLLKAFSKFPSVQKARVVRDKRTTKSKGFGFVSFSDGDEYFQAARDMQGKYIGSHPVLLRRATTEVRAAPVQQKGAKHGKQGKGGTAGGAKVEQGGVHKKQPKTKGGLKVLG